MLMVWHYLIRKYLYWVAVFCFFYNFFKNLIVVIFLEDCRAGIRTIQNVVDFVSYIYT